MLRVIAVVRQRKSAAFP